MKYWRENFIFFVFFCLALLILARLFFVQVLKGEVYCALAEGQHKFLKNIEGERGKIYFKNHDLPIVTNKPSYFLYVSPAQIPPEDREKIATLLSEILNLEKKELLEKLQKSTFYQLIKEDLEKQELEILKQKNIKGVYIGKKIVPAFPYNEFASHILGFVNEDGKGQYGVEGYWDDVLSGKKEVIEGEKSFFGYFQKDLEKKAKGADLILTIDFNIQYMAEKLLKKAKKELEIEGGTIIVIDPNTGKIIALANLPSFNPNKYFEYSDYTIFQNSAIQKVFEPGSVFKAITMAGALNEKVLTPFTTYKDPGVVKIGGYSIYNYGKRRYKGNITMREVLEKSINTGAIFAEKKLGHKKFLEYIEKFGIFEKTGVDLEGEVYSLNKELKKGYEINFATASFGQGIEMTPLQLVRAYCAIANGGKLVRPYIVEEIKKGNKILKITPKISRSQVISFETSSKLTAMLVSVVENGFGKRAKIPGYYIAGKTGTAQVPWSALGIKKKGYSPKTWQSFIGYAPAFNPRFLILVKLDNPKTKTAEYSAVPLFRELAKYIIDYWQIPPSRE